MNKNEQKIGIQGSCRTLATHEEMKEFMTRWDNDPEFRNKMLAQFGKNYFNNNEQAIDWEWVNKGIVGSTNQSSNKEKDTKKGQSIEKS